MRRAGAQPETEELIALVDLGSNASRFLLARVVEGRGFEVLQKERVQTRLGDGPPGRLRPAAVDATHADWKERGLPILQSPTEMDFGRTFVAGDPDGHRLRVFFPTGP